MNEDKDSIKHGIAKYHHFENGPAPTSQLKVVYAEWINAYSN